MMPYYDHDGITLYHGDCREVLPQLPPVDLVLTDPPYGIGLQSQRDGHDWTTIGDDNQEIGCWALGQCDGTPTAAFASPMKMWPGKWRQCLIWDKGPAVGGGGHVGKCWKYSFDIIQVRDTPRLNGGRDEAILRYPMRRDLYSLHHNAKPVELIQYLVAKIPAKTILDMFAGSGTTGVAAKLEGRDAILIELEEKYCEIAAKRLEQGVLF